MAARKYLVKLPRDYNTPVKAIVAALAKDAEHPKDRSVCRKILSKIPDPPKKEWVLDYSQFELGPQEARTYNDIIESAELPASLKARELRG